MIVVRLILVSAILLLADSASAQIFGRYRRSYSPPPVQYYQPSYQTYSPNVIYVMPPASNYNPYTVEQRHMPYPVGYVHPHHGPVITKYQPGWGYYQTIPGYSGGGGD